MKKVAFLLSLALAGAAQAAVLYDNGPVFSVPGSPNLSVLVTPNTTLGAGAQISANNAVADNFTAGATWNVTKLTFYMYQTGSTAFSFTGLNYQIANAHTDAISWTSGSISNGGLTAYRVTSTSLGARDRAIYAIDVAVNLVLGPGNYVMRWQASGSLASGPWQPPVVPTNGGGNAMQSLAGAAFGALVDTGSGVTMELPFTMHGTVVPAPGALALLGLGGLVARRRR
ncbi:MAG: PEP-CTERM sorting domain-containing protein [Phycisphaerae bacterium]|nr:PEP-CTERM sorting domain-containing protein [Phycisphaerae bacterium]MBN8598337.1 PEP-CTERM sorting domain-containing protein [Planctomycetota bacterium]